MGEFDESLEVGIAAGLDIPTAMVVSERDEPPHQSDGKGSTRGTAIAILFGLAVMVLCYLSR
jgi:hypothetical protein